MRKTEGKVDVYGTIAYAPQNPWLVTDCIMSPSLRSPGVQDYERDYQG